MDIHGYVLQQHGISCCRGCFGKRSIALCGVFEYPVQIVMFTFGVQLIIKYGAKEGVKVSVIKRLISPLNIAMAIGLVLL